MALTDKLNAIGDAIREKTGKTEKLTLDQMPEEIASISGSGSGGSDTSDATATASDIRLGKTAYVKGRKITGTLEIPATALSMSNAQISLDAFGAVALSVSLVPENSTDEADIVWTSDNEAVATVDGGNVVWKGSGSCNITAKLQNRGLSATCAVTCGSATLALDPTNVSLEIDGTASVTAYLLPANEEAASKIVWESDNTAVATVENGVITWVGQGSCTVTASIPEYSLSASCTVRSAAVPADIMSNFKYLGATTYSPGTYTAWCPTGLIYDETRDVYAQFMNVHNTHYMAPNACELWFNTIDTETLAHTKPVFIARTAETTSANMASSGALGCCIKNGVYYMFSKDTRGYYKSTDGGATWTHEEYETGPSSNPWGCYVLSNGRMIMGSDVNDHKVYYSDDNGKNWTTVQCEHFNEPTFIDFGNGTLMAICRENKDSSNNLQPPWMHVSTDNGESWTASVAMTTVGYMGNNNCNAYVHDSYVELFVGCRNWANSPQWDENFYKINQYVLDLNKGPVDEFEFVNTVYYYKDGDNPQGNLQGNASPDDFSTPVIAIKDKAHALLAFYGPLQSGVTHQLVAVGNVPVDDFEIPSIVPETFNASQSFSGTADDTTVTVCESYGLSTQNNYPSIWNGYLKLDDIEDGGFVHIRQLASGAGDASGKGWLASPFIHVKDGKVLSATRHTSLGKSPVPKGLTSVQYYTYWGGQYPAPAGMTPFDRYAFIDGDYWWVYHFGSWFRIDSGDCDVTKLAGTANTDSPENFPYRSEGLTSYKVFSYPNSNWRIISLIEYDKKLT